MIIRAITEKEFQPWLALRGALWPEYAAEYLQFEAQDILQNPARCAVFVAEDEEGKLVGFAEVSIRNYADGCETRDVGYLEGWYVEAGVRRQGVGRRLVGAAESWAREKGCREMGSDCFIGNEVSATAHGKLGYQEMERLIHFRKVL